MDGGLIVDNQPACVQTAGDWWIGHALLREYRTGNKPMGDWETTVDGLWTGRRLVNELIQNCGGYETVWRPMTTEGEQWSDEGLLRMPGKFRGIL